MSLLDVLDEQLVKPGNFVFEKRKTFMVGFLPQSKQLYEEIARQPENISLFYNSELMETSFEELLKTIQKDIYNRALKIKNSNITKVETFEEFQKVLEQKGGFISAHWDGSAEEEEEIKNLTKATIRCIPLDAEEEAGVSLISGKPSARRVIFAKAY